MQVIASITTQKITISTTDLDLAVKHFRALVLDGQVPKLEVLAPEKKIWAMPEKGERSL